MTYPEPPDGSIVGWGINPMMLRAAYQRDDANSDTGGYDDGDRWGLVEAMPVDGPISWADVCRENRGDFPYLLTPTPLATEETPNA